MINKYDCFVVGESPMTSWRDAVEFTSGEDRELDMMISFDHMSADCFIVDTLVLPFSLRKLKRVMGHWQHILHEKGWNALYIENHDHPRIISRYGSEKYRTESGKSLATMCFMQSGTPFIYQGQEIGMTNSSQDSMLNFRDVQTFNTSRVLRQFHIPEKTVLRIINRTSRENARTPVQWSAGKNAGFSDAEPWFPVNPNYTDINVEAQEKDPQSLLNYYRKLLKVRKENPVLIYGDFTEYYHLSGRLFCYSRSYKGKRALVICSFSESKLRFKTPKGFDLHEGELVLSSLPEAPLTDSGCVLKPYEARVYLFDFTNTGK